MAPACLAISVFAVLLLSCCAAICCLLLAGVQCPVFGASGSSLASPARSCRLHPAGMLEGTCAQRIIIANAIIIAMRLIACCARIVHWTRGARWTLGRTCTQHRMCIHFVILASSCISAVIPLLCAASNWRPAVVMLRTASSCRPFVHRASREPNACVERA